MPAQAYEREKNGIRLDLLGGMNTMLPTDLMQQGYPYLQNVRRNLAGRAIARPPLGPNVLTGTITPATSMTLMNDPYMGAPGYVLVLGAAGLMYVNTTQVVSGLSGSPLSFVTFRPNASPQPWCYVADPDLAISILNPVYPSTIYGNPIAGMVKVRSDSTAYKTGIAEPQVPPKINATGGPGPNWVIYRYVYRSSATGAVSNPSPESAALTLAQTPVTPPAGPILGNDPRVQFNAAQYNTVSGQTYIETSAVPNGTLTDYVIPTNFSLNVPTNVQINGVQVQMNWFGQNAGTGLLVNVSLFYQGQQLGLTKSPGILNGSVATGSTLQGGTSDNWGTTLTPAIVNDTTFGFGVQIEAVNSGGSNRSFLVSFTVTVYYTNQNAVILATKSPDPQVDKVDIYRSDPALDNFTYVGTIANATADTLGLSDILSDLAIANNPILQFDNYEPFPSIDLPRSGICTVTAVNEAVSGIAIVMPGSGQTDGTYVIASVGGGGTGATVQIVILGGIITTATVLTAGANYTSVPTFPVPVTTGTTGTLGAIISPVSPGAPNVTWVSGDQFNVRWLPGDEILLGGYSGSTAQTAWTLYARPTSPTTLAVFASIIDPITGIPTFTYPAAGTNLTFAIAAASLAAEPSPAIWGPTPESGSSQAAFYFGLDPLNPGDLLWSKGNNFDSAPDTNRVTVTSPSEMLMNGAITSELSTVFSTERFWLIYPNFSDAVATVTGTIGQQWTLIQAQATRGLYMRYAIAALGSMIAYRAKDCIAMSQGGGPEQSLTDSIYNLFPHGGTTPQPVTIGGFTVFPPDDTKPNAQTLTLTPSYLFYNYQDTTGTPRTLVYDIEAKGWYVDVYNPTVNCHLFAVGTTRLLTACTDGTVRLVGGGTAGSEAGSAIIATRSENGGDARALKRVGDLFFKGEIQTGNPVGLQFWQSLFTVALAGYSPATLTGTGSVAYYTIDFTSGFGDDIDDIGAVLSWAIGSSNVIDLWQPSWTELPEIIQDRPSDWSECNVIGNKLIRGMIIEMDSFNAAKAIKVERSDSQTLITPNQAAVTANGQTLVPFTFDPNFTAHMLRIVSTDGVKWRMWGPDAQWICDPWPDYTPLYSAWQNLGSDGAKYLRSILVPMDTNGASASFKIVSTDGPTVTFTATTPTAVKTPVAFAFVPPIIVHDVQLQCLSNAAIWNDEVKWFFDPYPELIPAYTPIMEISGPDNKFMQGIKIVADTANNFVGDTNPQPVSFQVLYDGGQIGPVLGPSLFNGKQTQVYSFNPPFNAHDVQIVPLNPVRIWMPGMGADDVSEWVFQPTPETATTWSTEASTFGLYGWCFIYQINLAYVSTSPVTMVVTTDQGSFTLTFPPSTGGANVPSKILLKCPRNKWKVVSFTVTAPAPGVQLWQELTEVWIRSWGETSEFHKINPFGGPSAPGATI